MKEAWVDIVEAIANAPDFVFKLGDSIAVFWAPLLDYIQLVRGVAGQGGAVGRLRGAA